MVESFGEADGIQGGTIWGFAFERNGTVWAAGLQGISRRTGTRWQRVGVQDGFTGTAANAVYIDKAGTVGVFSRQGLFLKSATEQKFCAQIGQRNAFQPPVTDQHGRIYLMDGGTGIRVIDSLEQYDQLTHP